MIGRLAMARRFRRLGVAFVICLLSLGSLGRVARADEPVFTLSVSIDAVKANAYDVTSLLKAAFPGGGPTGRSASGQLSLEPLGHIVLKPVDSVRWPQSLTVQIPAPDVASMWTGTVREVQIALVPAIYIAPEHVKVLCTALTVDCSADPIVPPTCKGDEPDGFAAMTLFVPKPSGLMSTTLDKKTFQSDALCKPGNTGDFSAWIQVKPGDQAREVIVHDLGVKPAGLTCNLPAKSLGGWIGAHNTLIVSYAPYHESNGPSCDLSDAAAMAPASCLPKTAQSSSRGDILPTNQGLDVVVVFPPSLRSKVSAPGAVQVSPPTVQPSSLPGPAKPGAPVILAEAVSETPPNCAVQRWHLGPRAAGGEIVTVVLTNAAGDEQKGTTYVAELAVEAQYVGAIRVGLGMSFARFPDGSWGGSRTYGIHQSPDGGSVIHQDGEAFGNYELVAGYTAFIFTVGGPGESSTWWRRPASRLTNLGFGLYAGLGVASVSTTGTVNGFTSAYVGPEISLGGVAVQGLFGARRDVVLADGYPPGTHVPAAGFSLPTQSTYYFAAGLSVSVTSDIFKIAGASVP